MRRSILALLLAPLGLMIVLPGPVSGQYASLVAQDGTIDLNRYYTADETNRMLVEWAELFPELTHVEQIGTSLLGAPLMVITITNEATGPAHEKPALYVDGGLHAAELTGSSVATHVIAHLLSAYGSEPQVTRLLDTRAVYVRPKFNPDGSDLVLRTDQALRSSVNPVDQDGDGVADEDPADDLDGDGWLTRMRWADPEGDWYADPADPRIMRRVSAETPAEVTRYSMDSEGVDDDGDGRRNEDGIGGLDLNRNFPRNWEPQHLQPGAGDFPLSEPETYAAVRFIHDHPNITGIVHGHTSGGFVYRLPSASAPSLFPQDDLELIVHLGEEYTRSTGRPVRPSATHPTEHRYGTLISWGFWDQGVIGWVPEYSPGPEMWVTDYDGDGEISELEEMRYNDEVLGGRYFSDWTPIDHPELGAVEVGGWHTKFWGQNPPAEHLAEETTPQLPWILYLAQQSPMVELTAVEVEPGEGGDVVVRATVRNEGFLPTSLTGRGATGDERSDGSVADRVVRPVFVSIDLDGTELVDGEPRVDVGHLAGAGPSITDVGPRERTVTWTVRAMPGAGGPRVRVTASSDKGGTDRSDWIPAR
ncbi:MAG TPA: M14 family metallopeptidase [Longimicrobiales bacterium]|nr:M14 family metallopeptidase [Longimicrobiales bacterium]